MKKATRMLIMSTYTLFIFLAILLSTTPLVRASPALTITVDTNKQSYYLRENVKINTSLKLDGSPIQELIALTVYDPYKPISFRTLRNGATPPAAGWTMKIIELYPCDDYGVLKQSFKVGIDSFVRFKVTVKNNDPYYSHYVKIWVNAYDRNNVPFGTSGIGLTLSPGSSITDIAYMPIPEWIHRGAGTVYANVWDPNDIPYCPENSTSFILTSRFGVPTYSLTTESPEEDGTSTFKLQPNPIPGTYSAQATSEYGVRATDSATFEVMDASFPPQASFVYYPPSPVVENATVTFDASASTAEGYGDYIVSYEWNFGDGTPKVKKTGNFTNPPDPLVYHAYTTAANYTVTLNVTDAEGLWSTTSKPITILEPWGPTANFTYSPPNPIMYGQVTFDASASLPGWDGTTQSIVSYAWDFNGDMIWDTTENDPITYYVYMLNGTYTVNLKVTDAKGRWNTTSRTLNVTYTAVIHEVIVTSITRAATEAYPTWGYPDQTQNGKLNIYVVVKNNGTTLENFTVTAYANTTLIGTIAVKNLAAGAEKNLTFAWDILHLVPNPINRTQVKTIVGYYTISANATIVPGDINPANNKLTDGTVRLKYPGDVNGDNKVWVEDLWALGRSWGSKPGQTRWNPQTDFDNSKWIWVGDLYVMGKWWGFGTK